MTLNLELLRILSLYLCIFTGEVGDWINWFTVAQNEMVDAIHKDKMNNSKLTFDYRM